MDWRDKSNWHCNQRLNPYGELSNDGVSLNPYEVMFVKVKAHQLDLGARHSNKPLQKASRHHPVTHVARQRLCRLHAGVKSSCCAELDQGGQPRGQRKNTRCGCRAACRASPTMSARDRLLQC